MRLGKYSVEQLEKLAKGIRQDLIRTLAEAGSGHSGGPLGSADLFTTLYFDELNLDPQNPKWDQRDRFILSAGHMCPIQYTTMAHRGFFPIEELKTLRKWDSRLQGHPGIDMGLPGLEVSTGSLGQGLGVGVGIAIAGKYLDKQNWRVYTLTGDGECQEGSIWEAAMCAGHYKLDNLVNIVDRNYCQIDGRTEDVMTLDPLIDKWKAFNWHVIEINGHNFHEILAAFDEARKIKGKPTCIYAHTLMGKGVSFMEDDYRWHGKPPKPEEAEIALRDLA